MKNEREGIETSGDVANPVDVLVMFDLQDANKKLILHAAYCAISLEEWKHSVLSSDICGKTKKELIGKIPGCDPLDNLMRLAERLLPEFNVTISINKNIEIIKRFVYAT